MATHNGGKFVREQICSILAQLSADDELVITDDCSTDDTIQIISDIGDSRIDLWRSPIHLGHVGAFTNSMQRAGGEIVLLADQDDIWLPHRVELFRAAFHDPAPAVVATAFVEFDAIEQVSGKDWIRRVQPTASRPIGDVLLLLAGGQNYWGCTMGLNRGALEAFLPVPSYVKAHDHWLASIGIALGGVVQLPIPTVARRIHGGNMTQPESFARRLRYRATMLRMLRDAKGRTTGRAWGGV